jgi:hypothetical protein
MPTALSAQHLMTTASNVRLRAEPATSSPVRALLRLGTELAPAGSDSAGWTPVLLPGGEGGWIASGLVQEFSDSTRLEVTRGVIRSRLERPGSSFDAGVELVDFVEKVLLAPELPREERAGFELARLEALRSTAREIPFRREQWSDQVAAWIGKYDSEIRYNEPGGEWMLNSAYIWERQLEYRDTSAADHLAWFAVENGLGGECEGFLVCYVERANVSEGEYLRRQPRGTHADAAMERIRQVAMLRRELAAVRDFFDPQRDCADLTAVVHELRSAVEGTAAADGSAALNELTQLARLCR